LRQLISQYTQDSYIGVQMGQTYNDIEVDEPIFQIDDSLFSRTDGSQCWVFGIITRQTREARCWAVQDRSADTLLRIVQENIPSGFVVYSDGW